jgi:hypothetical protein
MAQRVIDSLANRILDLEYRAQDDDSATRKFVQSMVNNNTRQVK